MLNKDFKEFVGLLNSTGVEYLVVGGYALAAFGHPRYTGDIDIWVRSTEGNAQALLQVVRARVHALQIKRSAGSTLAMASKSLSFANTGRSLAMAQAATTQSFGLRTVKPCQRQRA